MKTSIFHLTLTLAILYAFDYWLPTSKFWIQLIGAFLVSCLFYDFTNQQLLVRVRFPMRFWWEGLVKRYLRTINASQADLDQIKKVMHKWIIPSKGLSRKLIRNASEVTAAGLVLGMQRDTELKCAEKLTFVDFKSIAKKASEISDYRAFLIRQGTKYFPNTNKISEKLEAAQDYTIGDDLKTISDTAFFDNLKNSSDDIVHVFTTTSQLSSDFLSTLGACKENIRELNYYICSPFIIRDRSLENLTEEYQNPGFVLPPGQFICDQNGKVNVAADTLRRVIRILAAISAITNEGFPFAVNIILFKNEYPGIKIKLLEKARYAQLQPGPLSYPNNIYRFGIEVKNIDDFAAIKNDVDKFRSGTDLQVISTSRLDLKKMRIDAVKEAAIWLWQKGVSGSMVEMYRPEIIKTVPGEFSKSILDDVIGLLDKGEGSIKEWDEICNIESRESESIHISVGLIIQHEGKALLIKKSDPFYQNKYSVVAGHVNKHESPHDAIAREVKEELGVDITEPKLLGDAFNLTDECRYHSNKHIWYLFTAELSSHVFVLDESEIEKVKWVEIERLEEFKGNLTEAARSIVSRVWGVT